MMQSKITRLSGPSRRGSAGMTLVECLGYVVVLAVFVNIALSIFMSASRLNVLGTVAADRIIEVEEVRMKFSDTVRQAQAIVPGVASFKTGEDQLVLALPPSPDGEKGARYVVFGNVVAEDRFTRLEITESDGGYEASASSTYRLPLAGLRFAYDTSQPEASRSVALTLDAKNAAGDEKKPPVPYRFVASLRSKGVAPFMEVSAANETSAGEAP